MTSNPEPKLPVEARELLLRMCEVHAYAPGRGVHYFDGTLFELTDAEGVPISAQALFQRMRADAPCPAPACDAFEQALAEAVSGLERPWPAPLSAVLALEDAFTALARSMERGA